MDIDGYKWSIPSKYHVHRKDFTFHFARMYIIRLYEQENRVLLYLAKYVLSFPYKPSLYFRWLKSVHIQKDLSMLIKPILIVIER